MSEQKDKKEALRGYAIVKGNTKYKTSESGVGPQLMISKLPYMTKVPLPGNAYR